MTSLQTATRPAAPLTATVTIRPLEEEDRERLLAFGRALPAHEVLYLQDDFHSPEIISRLINARFAENWRQLVAEVDGEIVAYGAARRLTGWSKHVADIHLLVSAAHRRHGLGTRLAAAIFDDARSLGVSKVIVEILQEQTGGQAIFERLGFHVEGVLRDHAQDRHGALHNLFIMAYHIK